MNEQELRIRRFNDLMSRIPLETLQKRAAEQQEQAKRDFMALRDGLSKGVCSLCDKPLTHFDPEEPCLHWLLWKAKGLKKKHFGLIFHKKSYHELEAYLRWVANYEHPIHNINDLDDEKDPSKVFETTIKYENLEWTLSCSKGDMEGHKARTDGNFPHYHLQMKKDGRVVINFGAFHIPFNDHDEFCFAAESGKLENLEYAHMHGAGMQALMDRCDPEDLLDGMKTADDEDRAQFHISTMITAKDGGVISGDRIADLIEESRRTGVPMAKLLRSQDDINVISTIEPGAAVPTISARKKRS